MEELTGHSPTTLGVIADTHVPDKVNRLHPGILPVFQANQVTQILHAGDICSKRVLDELSQVAPVTAVRGNRDLFTRSLQMTETLSVHGVQVALTHGHGGLQSYLVGKVFYLLQGYRLHRYFKLLARVGGSSQVVVFGHTHHPVSIKNHGRLLFNPGSACSGGRKDEPPSIGLLRIWPSGEVDTEFVKLNGWTIKNREWVSV